MKQDWKVTIQLTEQEGTNSPEPWYTDKDVVALIHVRLRQLPPIQDAKITSVIAEPIGKRYF